MHEKFINVTKKALLLAVFILPAPAFSATNIAMSQFLNDIRGSSFNLLIAKPHIVDVRNSKRRRRAIENGFKKEIRNMEILLRRLKLNAKLRLPGILNDIPQYYQNDKVAGDRLYKLIELQTTMWESKLTEDIAIKGDKKEDTTEAGLSDDIGADIDFDTDIIETTDDKHVLNDQAVTPGKVANDIFIEVGDNYAGLFGGQKVNRFIDGGMKEVTLKGGIQTLQDIYAPYRNNSGLPVPLPLHAVFGSAFKPDKMGAIHVMRLYVFVIVNDPETERVRVAAKPVPNFRWDRNEYYISAATGSVLRAIFSEALGVKVEDN